MAFLKYFLFQHYAPESALSLIHTDAADDMQCVDLGGSRISENTSTIAYHLFIR